MSEQVDDVQAIMEELAMPFDAEEVKWLPAVKTKDGSKAMAVPFVDARVVMQRLDDVLGLGGWQTTHREAKGGAICTLSIRINGEWTIHEDFGDESEQPSEGDREKAAFSNSLKRVAVRVGVGRYLYRIKPQWVDYDSQKSRFTKDPVLPAWARPQAKPAQKAATATVEKPPAVAAPQKPPDNRTILERVTDFEVALVGKELCHKGDLFRHVGGALQSAGYNMDIEKLPDDARGLVEKECIYFKNQRTGKAKPRPEAVPA